MKLHLISALIAAAGSAALAGSASAQVTQSYTYDGNGRLVSVATLGSATTATTNYTLDDADNRTSRTTVLSISNLLVDAPTAVSEGTLAASQEDEAVVEHQDSPGGEPQSAQPEQKGARGQ